MSSPYIGEIRLFAGSFAPAGWATCDGQILAISENDTLFNLIGTTYGGDGQNTFALPNLSGRAPVHMGTGSSGTTYQIGESGGVSSVTLTTQQIASHQHMVDVVSGGQQLSPSGALLATAQSTQSGVNVYDSNGVLNTTIAPTTIQPAGGSQPHDNMQPYLAVTYIISLYGIYPSPT